MRPLFSLGSVSTAVFSLNVPVPGAVRRLAGDLEPELAAFDTVRDRHTLVLKRFGTETIETGHRIMPEAQVAALRETIRPTLARTRPFELRTDRIEYFDRPTTGSGPVVYLAIEGDGLCTLHRRLVAEFGAMEGLEGDEYVPHVTLARGGTIEHAERLAERSIDPIEWCVRRLLLWDGRFGEPVGRIHLR